MDPSVDLKTSTSVVDGAHSGATEGSMSNGGEELGAEQAALEEYVVGTIAEKKLLRKVDLIMVPSLWFMCVMAYLDRNNIVRMINSFLQAHITNTTTRGMQTLLG